MIKMPLRLPPVTGVAGRCPVSEAVPPVTFVPPPSPLLPHPLLVGGKELSLLVMGPPPFRPRSHPRRPSSRPLPPFAAPSLILCMLCYTRKCRAIALMGTQDLGLDLRDGWMEDQCV
ncbi:hypothetical protein BHM03_00054104 [Ensete ventricosum]|nr:hypothetical protein BHM03_00054104 [Ensete ventricosum]